MYSESPIVAAGINEQSVMWTQKILPISSIFKLIRINKEILEINLNNRKRQNYPSVKRDVNKN